MTGSRRLCRRIWAGGSPALPAEPVPQRQEVADRERGTIQRCASFMSTSSSRVGCGALTAPAQRACAAQHPVHGRSRAADSHGRTPKLPSLGHSGACPELLRCIPGRREPLGAIAWLKEKPYIGVLSKKRGVNAFPYSMRVSRAAGSVQRLVAKNRQP